MMISMSTKKQQFKKDITNSDIGLGNIGLNYLIKKHKKAIYEVQMDSYHCKDFSGLSRTHTNPVNAGKNNMFVSDCVIMSKDEVHSSRISSEDLEVGHVIGLCIVCIFYQRYSRGFVLVGHVRSSRNHDDVKRHLNNSSCLHSIFLHINMHKTVLRKIHKQLLQTKESQIRTGHSIKRNGLVHKGSKNCEKKQISGQNILTAPTATYSYMRARRSIYGVGRPYCGEDFSGVARAFLRTFKDFKTKMKFQDCSGLSRTRTNPVMALQERTPSQSTATMHHWASIGESYPCFSTIADAPNRNSYEILESSSSENGRGESEEEERNERVGNFAWTGFLYGRRRREGETQLQFKKGRKEVESTWYVDVTIDKPTVSVKLTLIPISSDSTQPHTLSSNRVEEVMRLKVEEVEEDIQEKHAGPSSRPEITTRDTQPCLMRVRYNPKDDLSKSCQSLLILV
ncbi:hypothetical protein GQR58_014573 [Nymphon striatum]|nr:hypothetical protein GQR58_014573 [Nymphon striatum]